MAVLQKLVKKCPKLENKVANSNFQTKYLFVLLRMTLLMSCYNISSKNHNKSRYNREKKETTMSNPTLNFLHKHFKSQQYNMPCYIKICNYDKL